MCIRRQRVSLREVTDTNAILTPIPPTLTAAAAQVEAADTTAVTPVDRVLSPHPRHDSMYNGREKVFTIPRGTPMQTRFILRLLMLLTLVLVAAGCRNSAQENINTTSSGDYTISLEVEPDPPAVGMATLVVEVTDANGQPVANAERVAVRGDMNHAGMVPVFGVAEEAANGIYRVPFEWTMGGEWILSVTVEMPDGEEFKQDIELAVNS
jgi:hypothetical protein